MTTDIQPPVHFNTVEFARAIGHRPNSIRVRVCRFGSFHGVRPLKLPNGRLAWRPEDVQNFLLGHRPRTAQ